jgi:hypothetical protein
MAKIIVTGNDRAIEKLARIAAGLGAFVEPYFEALPVEAIVEKQEEPNDNQEPEKQDKPKGEVITRSKKPKPE